MITFALICCAIKGLLCYWVLILYRLWRLSLGARSARSWDGKFIDLFVCLVAFVSFAGSRATHSRFVLRSTIVCLCFVSASASRSVTLLLLFLFLSISLRTRITLKIHDALNSNDTENQSHFMDQQSSLPSNYGHHISSALALALFICDFCRM